MTCELEQVSIRDGDGWARFETPMTLRYKC